MAEQAEAAKDIMLKYLESLGEQTLGKSGQSSGIHSIHSGCIVIFQNALSESDAA